MNIVEIELKGFVPKVQVVVHSKINQISSLFFRIDLIDCVFLIFVLKNRVDWN